jgi:hypothetical protein
MIPHGHLPKWLMLGTDGRLTCYVRPRRTARVAVLAQAVDAWGLPMYQAPQLTHGLLPDEDRYEAVWGIYPHSYEQILNGTRVALS